MTQALPFCICDMITHKFVQDGVCIMMYIAPLSMVMVE